MLSSYSEINDEQIYQQLRYDLLVDVEESGDPKELPYSDPVGIPTIGVGFNLREPEVRDAILDSFGFNTVNPSQAEHGYITQIETAAGQTYLTGTQAERNAAVQEALNTIMYNRSIDPEITVPEGETKRPAFEFNDETEIRSVFDALIGGYENNINEWIPGIPNSEERVALVSLS